MPRPTLNHLLRNPHTQTYADALQRDPIAIIHGIVNAIRSSQLRRTEFKEILEVGNRRHKWQKDDGNGCQIPFL